MESKTFFWKEGVLNVSILKGLFSFESTYKPLNFPPSALITHDATYVVNCSIDVHKIQW